MNDIMNFKPQKQFLLCVDSDGCIIDGMTIKHLECFGPCLIEEWDFKEHDFEVIKYWNKINLYSMTRGINRFKGLLMALEFSIKEGYSKIDSTDIKNWIEKTKELSNNSLKLEIEATNSETLKKVLHWSENVNDRVENLPDEKKKAFLGVKDCLRVVSQYADIAVVSSANARAVEVEWSQNHLFDYVDVVMTQEFGSKADCLKIMLSKGYANNKVLMVGDAPGDIEAAKDCRVLYYPIIVDREVESWVNFKEDILDSFIHETYEKELMKECESQYIKDLMKRN
ncbi:HAD family hydrolase [[Clostridium] fimetarium]|uniref:Haloacid dehalogenase-like hydrolase n=1 Tax=[Clostridium] fimetarium TaxID=99656 RepID=A0A1I0NE05_9FIRM|nr:HAD hydrolase-like protein [[Clostridium] fimetarium]SEV99209.1 Haloacid dehalogenase-like hydrolase [[Clostridium] fimetarium]